jgi:DNA helicase-2/ATP-dependent DNA helicase PcrA
MFAPRGWDDGLDDAQLLAVTHGDEPLVIVAGAGTGKTRTLTSRVARLLDRGVQPERILLLTFTRRAADDMLARAAALSGRQGLGRRLRGGTFHAVAHQMVSAWCEPLGVAAGFSVLDPADAADAMDLLRDAYGLTGHETRMPRAGTLVDIYSRCVNTRRSLTEVLAVDFPWCEPHAAALSSLFRAYVARKRENAQLDFDDLLLYWRAALADEHLGAHMAAMFDHVLVDEYQDVNTLQVDIVRALRPDGRGLTVVGDDAQAVYGFRGADARHLHDLAAGLPGSTVLALDCNFRSLQPILDLANVVRPVEAGVRLVLRGRREGGRRPVFLRCHDAPGEARAVVDRVLVNNEQGMRLRDQAVLVRAAHHSDLIELELTARRVPFRKYGGLRFVEAGHVKDFVAALRVLDNPADDLAWFRLLRMHDDVGPARARQLLALLAPRRAGPAEDWLEVVAAAPARARVMLASTFEGLAEARECAGAAARVEAVRAVVLPLVSRAYTDSAARAEDLERLASAAAASDDLSNWLAEITLDPPASASGWAGPPHLDEDYLVISTVHSAKGLEWTAVHMPHLVDGAFPSDMALSSAAGLAEERRLFYVATTRARDQLTLYAPLRMPHHRRGRDDRHSLAPASRFLDAAALQSLEVQEQIPARAPVRAAGAVTSISVDLEALWS